MTVKKICNVGPYAKYVITVAGPSSYTTGGYEFTVEEVEEIICVEGIGITGGYMASLAEATVSGNSIKAVIRQFNYPATAAGPAEEVAAGTDLSSETIKVVILAK